MQEHYLRISSGSEKSQPYFSTSCYGDDGWTLVDKVKRCLLNFNNSHKFSDKVSTMFSTVGPFRQQRAPGALGRQLNSVVEKEDRDFNINPFNYALNTSRTLTAYNKDGQLEYFTKTMHRSILLMSLIIIMKI